MTKDRINEQIYQRIAKAKKIVVMSHQRPDGDAVGSVLAVGLALESIGKDAQMVLEDGVPATFRFLAGSERVCQKLNQDQLVLPRRHCGIQCLLSCRHHWYRRQHNPQFLRLPL